MKKLIIACVVSAAIPTMTLAQPTKVQPMAAQPMDITCQLNTPCQMTIFPWFNKIVHTYNVLAQKEYICSVSGGDGKSFSLNNIQPSPGVQLRHSSTLETPFEIIGPNQGEGAVTYTVKNNSLFEEYTLRYECRTKD